MPVIVSTSPDGETDTVEILGSSPPPRPFVTAARAAADWLAEVGARLPVDTTAYINAGGSRPTVSLHLSAPFREGDYPEESGIHALLRDGFSIVPATARAYKTSGETSRHFVGVDLADTGGVQVCVILMCPNAVASFAVADHLHGGAPIVARGGE